jgi:hypothetical protein
MGDRKTVPHLISEVGYLVLSHVCDHAEGA